MRSRIFQIPRGIAGPFPFRSLDIVAPLPPGGGGGKYIHRKLINTRIQPAGVHLAPIQTATARAHNYVHTSVVLDGGNTCATGCKNAKTRNREGRVHVSAGAHTRRLCENE